jgi:Flp pilus assembly protein CpaB
LEVVIVKSVSRYEPQQDVVFAKTKIPVDTTIQENMLVLRRIDLSFVHKQSVRDIREIVGKKAKVDIEDGEMIFAGKFGTADEIGIMEVKDKNNRLFSLELKGDQANGWWLKTDQLVDIIYVPDERAKARSSQSIPADSASAGDTAAAEGGELLIVRRLRNIRIAAIIDEKGKLLKNSSRTELPKFVSLEVNDTQDEFLAFAKSAGRLELSVIP